MDSCSPAPPLRCRYVPGCHAQASPCNHAAAGKEKRAEQRGGRGRAPPCPAATGEAGRGMARGDRGRGGIDTTHAWGARPPAAAAPSGAHPFFNAYTSLAVSRPGLGSELRRVQGTRMRDAASAFASARGEKRRRLHAAARRLLPWRRSREAEDRSHLRPLSLRRRDPVAVLQTPFQFVAPGLQAPENPKSKTCARLNIIKILRFKLYNISTNLDI